MLKNISKLVAGTSVAQLISFLAAPVITRLFSPSDFGSVTFLISIAGGIGMVATLRYEMAVILPADHRDSANLGFLSLITAFVIALASTAILFLADRLFFNGVIMNPAYGHWIYLLPLLIFLMAASSVFQQWYNHMKEYKTLAYSKIITSAGNNFTTLLMGFAGYGVLGLWLGNFAGALVVILFFSFLFYSRYRGSLRYFSLASQKALAVKYKYLPMANTPQVIVEMVQSYGIIYLLKILFTSSVVGFFSLSLRLLQAPMWLVGISIGQVFYKEASERYKSDGNLIQPVMKTIKTAALIALPVSVILLTLGPWLIALVFGKAWTEAGLYARILAPWMFFDFVRSTISQTPLIIRKARPMFFVAVLGALCIIIPIVAGGLFFGDPLMGFVLLTITHSLYSIGVIVWIISIARKSTALNTR